MQRTRCYLFVIICLFLIGCQPSPSDTEGAIHVQPSSTKEERISTSITTKTASPSLTATNTAVLPQATQSIDSKISCGQSFCQAAWPGLLDRPIPEGYRNTIALAYPYANTRGGTLPPHHGVEFPNPSGTPVHAAGSGEVIYSGTDDLDLLGPYTGFYGNVVILKHQGLFEERDVFTLYAHLSTLGVEVGDKLNQGDKLGEVGASGAADGSHLHFEVRLDENEYSRTVNPVLWFAPNALPDHESASTLAGLIRKRNGDPLSEFEFTLERIGSDGSIEERFYLKTYVSYDMNQHPTLMENFVLADIPIGEYRLVFIYGSLNEYFFRLEASSLGTIEIIVD